MGSDPTVAHLHQSAEVFDPRAEYAFSYLQVIGGMLCPCRRGWQAGCAEYAFSYLQVTGGILCPCRRGGQVTGMMLCAGGRQGLLWV